MTEYTPRQAAYVTLLARATPPDIAPMGHRVTQPGNRRRAQQLWYRSMRTWLAYRAEQQARHEVPDGD